MLSLGGGAEGSLRRHVVRGAEEGARWEPSGRAARGREGSPTKRGGATLARPRASTAAGCGAPPAARRPGAPVAAGRRVPLRGDSGACRSGLWCATRSVCRDAPGRRGPRGWATRSVLRRGEPCAAAARPGAAVGAGRGALSRSDPRHVSRRDGLRAGGASGLARAPQRRSSSSGRRVTRMGTHSGYPPKRPRPDSWGAGPRSGTLMRRPSVSRG